MDLTLTDVKVTIIIVNVDSIGTSKDSNDIFTWLLVCIISKYEVPQWKLAQNSMDRCALEGIDIRLATRSSHCNIVEELPKVIYNRLYIETVTLAMTREISLHIPN
jgi:hypothetical protein